MNNTNTDSLKAYYVKLQTLYNNALNMLTAINQSLMTNSSEIAVNIADTDDVSTTVRIPSFLNLESRLEQLDTNFSNLVSIQESGSAWMQTPNGSSKIELIRANTAPIAPVFSTNNVYASLKDNTFLKDLVSPRTYLKLAIGNLPANIDKMCMKKFVIYTKTLYDQLIVMNIKTYDEFVASLINKTKGVDYDEYESVINLPIKKDTYASSFKIVSIPEDSQNPWIDTSNDNLSRLSYKLVLDTLEYYDQEDSSISFTLRPGDKLAIGNSFAIYTVKSVDTKNNSIIIEETVGHVAIQTYEENSEMQFVLYNDDYSQYEYVEVPLEENPYICVFLSTIFNNVRSLYSDAYCIDLTNIYMKDSYGNFIKDSFGNNINYITYYNNYCTNIGDLILGLTETAYPQVSNYTAQQLYDIQYSESLQQAVSQTIDNVNVIQVVPINKHLSNDTTSEEIINLHAQKNDINSQLQTIQDNIDQVYNTLISTDFSQETSVTQQTLQSQVQQYYTQRTTLQKQLNSVINNINAKSLDLHAIGDEIKYRARGVTSIARLEEFLHSLTNSKCDIIGLDVEYKYKSTSKDTTSVTVINSSTFTDWNKLHNIDRQRKLVFDETIHAYRLEYVDYGNTDNIIKWNQIDIPIRSGEDVIVRIRYKVNIGQPFVDIYTPWSDELTIVFPAEYNDDQQLQSILATNTNDTTVAGFREILINEGYEQHVTDKVVASDQVFYHNPERIYSGFNTPENNLISLKDKLIAMSQDIEKYKTLIDNETNSKFTVYLNYDDQTVELSSNNVNRINIYNTDHITGNFIRKEMNIVIKNTGAVRVNLYSIFPGNTAVPLILSDVEFYNEYITNYERVPLMINNSIAPQYMGQWIYFRQNNPYTKQDIYYNTQVQRTEDIASLTNDTPLEYVPNPTQYISTNNAQVLLGYRKRGFTFETDYNVLGINTMIDTFHLLKDYLATDIEELVPITEEQVRTLPEHRQKIENLLIAYVIKIVPIEGETEAEKIAAAHEWISDNSETAEQYRSIIVADYVKAYNQKQKDDYRAKRTELVDSIDKSIDSIGYLKKMDESAYLDKDWSWFVYSNSNYGTKGGESNKFLMKYEDIQGKNESMQTIYLDNTTSILNYMTKYHPNGFSQDQDFSGAFLFPNLLTLNTILTAGSEKDSVFIDVGESLSVPIIFEYYLDGTEHTSVSKSIFFDLRNSLISNPLHYMIEITGNYDFTATGDVYNNFGGLELQDSVTRL